MSKPQAKIYFVTGASRGIGLALVADIAVKDPSAIIYGGARDPSGASQLKELAAKYPGRIEAVKYVAGDKEGNIAIAKEIGLKHGHVDTVIANAGIANYIGKVHETPIHQFEEHFAVNVIGPIVLFQAFRDLLQASPLPRFVPISARAGSIELMALTVMDIAPYGTSKAALNWITRKIHFENEWLVTFPICPGPVDTDLARKAIAENKELMEHVKHLTLLSAPAAASIVFDIIAASTRAKDGGLFHNQQGGFYPY